MAVSSNPVDRANAELVGLMEEFNELVGQGQATSDDDGSHPADVQPPEPQDQLVEPEPAPESGANDDSYKQRWESLKGIVKSKDSQITTLQDQVGQLIAQNAQIMEQLQQNPSATTQPGTNTADTSAENLLQIAETLKDQYGDEIGGFLTKLAQHVQKLEDAGQNFGSELASVKSTVTVSRAEAELAKLCPIWREVDTDQGFIAWLQKVEPYSQKKMLDILNEKWSAGDVNTVAAIFNEYIGLNHQPQPSTTRDPRESLVTPGKKGASTTVPVNPNENTKIYTEAEASQFYRDVQSGKYRGREAEANRIDQEITVAYLENRVR